MKTIKEKMLHGLKKEITKLCDIMIKPNGEVLFIDKKTHKLDRKLIYKKYPDKYYDTYRKKIVDCSGSAYVQLIQNRKLKQYSISITDWSKICETGRCCKTRVIAFPIKDDEELIFYDRVKVIENITKFKLYHECKIYKGKKYVRTEREEYRLSPSPEEKKTYILRLFEKGVPVKALSHLYKLKTNTIYEMVKDINPRAFKKKVRLKRT